MQRTDVRNCRHLQRALRRGDRPTVRVWTWARLPAYLGARPPSKDERASSEYLTHLMLTNLVEHGLSMFTYRSLKDEKGTDYA